MGASLGGVPQGFDRGNITIEAMKREAAVTQKEQAAEQASSVKGFEENEKEAVNPFAAAQKREKVAKPVKSRIQKMMESKEKLGSIPIQEIEDKAGDLAGGNPEFSKDKEKLIALRKDIKPSDKKEDILRKVKEAYSDQTLAVEVLKFLLETTDGELNIQVQGAIADFRKGNEVQIKAGQNITPDARDLAKQGVVATPSEARDNYYQYITAPQLDTFTLFEQLAAKHSYSYEEMEIHIKFLLSALGRDNKSEGPSVSPGKLSRLISETRSLQAILQEHLFFKGRMGLIDKMFQTAETEKPPSINFQTVAELFMHVAKESHPSSDRVRQHVEQTLHESVGKTGKREAVVASIILDSQLLAGVEEVSSTYILRSPEHKKEVKQSLIEFGENQDDLLDEFNDRLPPGPAPAA